MSKIHIFLLPVHTEPFKNCFHASWSDKGITWRKTAVCVPSEANAWQVQHSPEGLYHKPSNQVQMQSMTLSVAASQIKIQGLLFLLTTQNTIPI